MASNETPMYRKKHNPDTNIVSSLVSALVVCVVTNKKTPLLSYAE